MRECKRHPPESQPSGGVCARCLEERLVWLWRGKSFRLDDSDRVSDSSVTVSDDPVSARSNALPLAPREDVGSVPALNARKQLLLNEVLKPPVPIGVLDVHQRKGSDIVDGSKQEVDGNVGPSDARDPKVAMAGRTELHAQWQRNFENGLEFVLGFSKATPSASPKLKSKSLESDDSEEPSDPFNNSIKSTEDIVARLSMEANPRFSTLLDEPRMFRSRSLPLDSRSRTEDTALRVINEQADDIYFEDRSRSLPLETRSSAEDTALRVINEQAEDVCFEEEMQRFGYYGIDRDGNGGGESLNDNLAEQGCFSPKWQSKKSPKWVKVLVSPMTSRNRIFPSRSKDDVRGRGSRKRGTRFSSSDWSHKQANGGTSPQRRNPVFSWLQGAETKNHGRHDHRGQLASSSSSSLSNSVSTDSWLRDLTTVGHLHEIAEELEIVEESSEEEEEAQEEAQDGLKDVVSFGKFLLSAARRQPNAGLTRLVSATSSGPAHQC